MVVGSLGKVIFACSSFYIKTLDSLNKDTSYRWTEHQIIGSKPKLQFDGENLENIKFNIHLNAAFNVNPSKSAQDLKEYGKKGEHLRFILGGKVIGTYVIENISELYKAYTALGTVTKIDLSIQLKEYN